MVLNRAASSVLRVLRPAFSDLEPWLESTDHLPCHSDQTLVIYPELGMVQIKVLNLQSRNIDGSSYGPKSSGPVRPKKKRNQKIETTLVTI